MDVSRVSFTFEYLFYARVSNRMENVNRYRCCCPKLEQTSLWSMRTYARKRTKNVQKCSHSCFSMNAFGVFCFYCSLSKWSNYLRMNERSKLNYAKQQVFVFFWCCCLFPAATFFTCMHYMRNVLIHIIWIESSFSVEWHMMPPFRSIQQQQQQQQR